MEPKTRTGHRRDTIFPAPRYVIDFIGAPNGNRTRVFAVKGRRPGPLDDGRGVDQLSGSAGSARCYKVGRSRWQVSRPAKVRAAKNVGGKQCAPFASNSPAARKSCASRRSSRRRRARAKCRLRQHAIGINFIDIYHRSGFYPPAKTPFTPGSEGAGEVVEVGPSVQGFKPGDRVAYAGSPGAYAEERNIEARFLFKLPQAISYETAAAMMLKGLTAQYLRAPDLSRQRGRHDPGPRGGRRGWAHPVPMGQGARRNRDRLRRHGRKRPRSPRRPAQST